MKSDEELYLDNLLKEIEKLSYELSDNSSLRMKINVLKRLLFILKFIFPNLDMSDMDNYGNEIIDAKKRELMIKESNYKLLTRGHYE